MGRHLKTSSNGRKLAAIAAALAVAGLGAVSTLASWTDTQWVFGGTEAGGPGVGTSTFAVQQNTLPDPGPEDETWETGWISEPDNPGGRLSFSPGALALSPGDSVYAPVALRTLEKSTAGEVTLQAAVAAQGITVSDPDDKLWDAVEVAVATDGQAFTCDSAAFTTSSGPEIIAQGNLDDAEADELQNLAADADSTQYYCFRLSLPADAPSELQGLSIAPAWEFVASSA